MENSSESSGFEPGRLAGAVLQAGEQLLHKLIMNPHNATISAGGSETPLAPSTHLNHIQSAAGLARDPNAINDLPCFKDLIAVLVECFTIISLGYLSSRFKLISTDARDLSAYLTTFALPMVIFLNIAQMEFQTINMSFLFCMLISKLLLFITVTLITLAISYPANFSFAGALSILSTQSNDFALGYPLIKSLYGESRPEMLSYLNLMGPIQLLIINPLGIIMLEYGKSKNLKQQHCGLAKRRRLSASSTGRPPKDCIHCSSGGSSRSAARSHHSEQQVIKTNHQQFISNQSNNVGAPVGNRARVKLAPSSQLQRISSSLINLSDGKENNGSRALRELDKNCFRSSSANTQCEPADDQQVGSLAHSPLANALKRKNIRSLTLVMPPASLPTHHFSSESIESAGSELLTSAAPPLHQQRHISLEAESKPTSSQQHQQTLAASLRSHSNSPTVAPAANSSINEGTLNTVYTRPKLFNLSASSKWFARTGNTGNPDNTSAFAHDNTQLRNVLADELDRCNCSCHSGAPRAEDSKLDLSFISALLTNPLIIASILALAVNLIHGPELPKFVTKVSNTIAASFAAPALFVVGLSMYGKFNLMVRNPNDFLLSSVLVLTKVLILPSIMRTVVMLIVPHYSSEQEVPHLADFSYLYGLLPTAPGACIIAKQYEVLTNVVSICMLLSTLISAPLVLGTSAVISQAASMKPVEVMEMIAQTLRASSSITLVFTLLILYLLWKSNRRITYSTFMNPIERIIETANRAKATHLFTFLLTLTQLVISIGGIVWLFMDTSKLKLAPDHAKYPATTVAPVWHDKDDLLANEESRALHNRIMELGPHGFFVARQGPAPGEEDVDLASFTAMCTMQYVFSSGGLLMARFIILCIVLTNFAKRYGSHQFGRLVCSLIMKVYPLVGIAIILNLVFETQHLSCLPGESSLPTWPSSIYTRLLFNGILLLSAVPLFTATFRLENKAAWLKAQEAPATNLRDQRRFKQSSSSLSSDTSSTITTSTNLDTAMNRQAASSRRNSANLRSPIELQQNFNEFTGSVLDCKALEQNHEVKCDANEAKLKQVQQARPKAREEHDENFNITDECELDEHLSHDHRAHTQSAVDFSSNLYHVNNPATSNSWRHQLKSSATNIENPHYAISVLDNSLHSPTPTKSLDANQGADLNGVHGAAKSQSSSPNKTVTYEAQGQTILPTEQQQRQQQACWSPASSTTCCSCAGEFDKYSILIVFMLFQAFLNVTSMVQQLSQSNSYGTFMLVEMANVALDYGQGLITFIVICLQMFPIQSMLSPPSVNMFCSRQAREIPVLPLV